MRAIHLMTSSIIPSGRWLGLADVHFYTVRLMESSERLRAGIQRLKTSRHELSIGVVDSSSVVCTVLYVLLLSRARTSDVTVRIRHEEKDRECAEAKGANRVASLMYPYVNWHTFMMIVCTIAKGDVSPG